ncbi:MAG: glycosyltransferase family 4 protein [Methyloceanibacter sp.]|uniref:glycosyltransferase family 4 protein n=1 Tax=Methyloceanibacter sp. TaxID=1965321 RepID=UPI003D6DA28D
MRSKGSPTRVAYCGPIAQPGQPARGGYESANRRLIDDLRLRGLDVLEFPYPVALGTQFGKGFAYARRFAVILAELVQQRRRFDILHLTPLYRHFLYAETALCLIAWSLGKRVVFDIRAGSFIRHYRKRSSLYRTLAEALLRRADMLAVEGKEDLPFVEARRDKPILYLPNYVKTHAPQPVSARHDTPIRIAFLGRVVPEKGIETALRALRALQDMGMPAHLDVIGEGDESYLHTLAHRTLDLPVKWHGALPADVIRPKLAAAHFFIFPTTHDGEGHSNALTEAMAEGLVPICSGNGFNRSVVGECGRVLPMDASGEDYAAAIAAIGTGSAWRSLSEAARSRVAQHFSSDAVLPELIETYRTVTA